MVLKNNVCNVSGMIEKVKTNTFFIWQNFGLCTVLPLDGLMCRWLDFRHNTQRLVLFVLLCLQQVERVFTVSTKTCHDKYSIFVCVYYPFSCHSIPAMLKRVYVCTTWWFPFAVGHCDMLRRTLQGLPAPRLVGPTCPVSRIWASIRWNRTWDGNLLIGNLSG